MAIIECWKHGVKVTERTKCDTFDKPCGEVPKCYFKTKMAKYQFLQSRNCPETDTQPANQPERKKVTIDEGFF